MRETIKSERLSVTVDSVGAEMVSIEGLDGTQYLCPDERRNWDGKAPVLFPNTGWVRDGYALIGEKKYPYEQHGFARRMEFVLTKTGEDRLVCELCWSEKTLEHYPGRFVLQIVYTVRETVLQIESSVYNAGNETMYCSLGFHPGFSCPILMSEKPEDYCIIFPETMTASRLVLADAMVLRKEARFWNALKTIPIRPELFREGSFSMTDLSSKTVRLQSKASGRYVEIALGDYPNLVIWAPKEEPVTNICVEPWYGMPDAVGTNHRVEEKPFTLRIGQGETRTLGFSIICS